MRARFQNLWYYPNKGLRWTTSQHDPSHTEVDSLEGQHASSTSHRAVCM